MSRSGDQTPRVEPQEDGFVVLLGRDRLRSPAGRIVVLPSRKLAQAVAAEIRIPPAPATRKGKAVAESGLRVDLAAAPLLRLVLSAVDYAALHRDEMVNAIMRFAATDLLCYRADAPEALVARQTLLWQPPLDWVAERFGARLIATRAVAPVAQTAEAMDRLRRAIAAFPVILLPALHQATAATGSAVLALALAEGAFCLEEVGAAAHLDEVFQSEKWGADEEAAARRRAIDAELAAAARLFDLWRQSAV